MKEIHASSDSIMPGSSWKSTRDCQGLKIPYVGAQNRKVIEL